jgi:hypothetical protein
VSFGDNSLGLGEIHVGGRKIAGQQRTIRRQQHQQNPGKMGRDGVPRAGAEIVPDPGKQPQEVAVVTRFVLGVDADRRAHGGQEFTLGAVVDSEAARCREP